jgi:hypothetical protein
MQVNIIQSKAWGGMITPVLTMSTAAPDQDQSNIVWTSKFFSFYLDIYKNELKNLIRTSKFKFSLRGLLSTNSYPVSTDFNK